MRFRRGNSCTIGDDCDLRTCRLEYAAVLWPIQKQVLSWLVMRRHVWRASLGLSRQEEKRRNQNGARSHKPWAGLHPVSAEDPFLCPREVSAVSKGQPRAEAEHPRAS